jgi:ketosteroid isomerase-like protein
MSETNAELLRSGYDAFAEGDVPAVLALFSPDITWHVPGRNPLTGVYTGHDEVVGFFGMLAERSDGTFNLDVHDILDNGDDKVVVLVTENATRNGDSVAFEAVHVWRMEDGLATRFQAFQHDDHEMDAFWS